MAAAGTSRLLKSLDRVITGGEAQVLIQLAEGSAVKLGENTQLDLNVLGRRENRVFTAALDVACGPSVLPSAFLPAEPAAFGERAHCKRHGRYSRHPICGAARMPGAI